MKNLFNNISQEEKNRILEQHKGGIKVMNENFSKLLNAKLGDAKPLVSEQPIDKKRYDMSSTKPKIQLKASLFLANPGERKLNSALGVKELPECFRYGIRNGLTDSELNTIIDAMDFPMDKTDARRLHSWANGGGWPGPMGGNYKEYGDLKNRVVLVDGLYYPAVEDLRSRYNSDESVETLGTETQKPELSDFRNDLINAYQYWIDCVNGKQK